MKLICILPLASLVLLQMPAALGSDAVARLCQAVKDRKQMIVDNAQAEIIWSDGAMFEVAGKFPPALEELIAAAKNHRDLKPTITRMSRDLAEWKDASISRSPKGDGFRVVKSSDGELSLTVSSAYIDYLRERYPNARIRIKAELQPILFLVGGVVRGAVMPIKS
jgi:hypothetical protein